MGLNRVLMLLENCSYPRDDRVRREALTLHRAGYQVIVISPMVKGQPWKEMVDGVRVLRFPEPPDATGALGYIWEYIYTFVAIGILSLYAWLFHGFDIVHTHHPPDTLGIIAFFYKLFGKRHVLDHHDLAPEMYYARFRGEGNSTVYKMLVWLEKFACKFSDRVIATNQSYKKIEMERDHVPEEHITIVRNGPDLKELRLIEPDATLQKEGITLVGYVGVMGIQDGIDYFVRALDHLVHEFHRTDIHCYLVGDGSALQGLKDLSAELNLTEYITFTGWVNSQLEVARYLSSVDICVAPEPSDPYNDRSTAAKVMEYMAMGKPVVAFTLPEHQFTAQGAAVYAKSNDEVEYAKKIIYLMDNPLVRQEMGQIGRDRILNVLSWEHQEKELLKAYKSLL
jgi:glycosyltransferase involved in cell wall biosynthesis